MRVTQEGFQMVYLFLVLMRILKKNITFNDTYLTIAIAYIIISEGLPFNLAQVPIFNNVLEL